MLRKITKSFLFLMVGLTMSLFGKEISIKPSPNGPSPYPRAPFHIPLVASLENNNEVLLLFEYPVGIAVVSITDATGAIVESRTIDTDQDDEVSILLDGCDSGSYTLHIEYGSIRLFGEFEIS